MSNLFDADLEGIAGDLREQVGCEVTLVTLLINDRQVILAQSSDPPLAEAMLSLRMEYSACQHAVAALRKLVIDDAKNHTLLRQNLGVHEIGIGAYAGMPIYVGEAVAASICAIEFKPRTWRPADIEALETAASRAATCLMMDHVPAESESLPLVATPAN